MQVRVSIKQHSTGSSFQARRRRHGVHTHMHLHFYINRILAWWWWELVGGRLKTNNKQQQQQQLRSTRTREGGKHLLVQSLHSSVVGSSTRKQEAQCVSACHHLLHNSYINLKSYYLLEVYLTHFWGLLVAFSACNSQTAVFFDFWYLVVFYYLNTTCCMMYCM